MARSWKETFTDFGIDVLQRIREDYYARLDDAAFEETIVGIKKATAALCETGIGDEKVILLLQKHWDLRRSEANEFLQQYKRIADKERRHENQ